MKIRSISRYLLANCARNSRPGVSLVLAVAMIAAFIGPAHASPPDGVITTFSDGSTQAELTFTEAGRRELYVTVPSGWVVTSATLGLQMAVQSVPVTDQKNEAAKYEGTWGVRAQQFTAAESRLTSVELFLAHTSSKPGDLTVEIREDDGRGYPSDRVLSSITRPVSTGGYRWEVFGFPEIDVVPGQPYWIVNYVGNLNTAKYPAVPSVGDYGYYIGMSLNNEYPNGESADFLTTPTGARWEKYNSRNKWDLLFRTGSVHDYTPPNISVGVADQSSPPYLLRGALNSVLTVVDLTPHVSEYLGRHRSISTSGEITLPLVVGSDSAGIAKISDLNIVSRAAPLAVTPAPAPTVPMPAAPSTASTPTASAVPQAATPPPGTQVTTTVELGAAVSASPTPAPTAQSYLTVTPEAIASSTPETVPLLETKTATSDLPEVSAPSPQSPPGLAASGFVLPTDVTIKSLGYGDATVQGVVGTTDIYFPGAGGYPLAGGNYLKLYLSHSRALLADRSVMSVRFNDIPLADMRLTLENAERTEVRIPLPKDLIQDSVNHVKLSFYMRIMDGVCTDELNNPALNSTIYSDSAIHYEYASLVRKPDTTALSLANYPWPFVRPSYPWADEIYFVLPENPSKDELTAAASISAKLGALAGGKPVTVTLALPSQLDAATREARSFIFVGKAESLHLPEELRAAASLEIRQSEAGQAGVYLDAQPVRPDSGILKEFVSPWNARESVLLVTGATDLAVRRAGTMLTGKTYINSLSGSRVVVTEDPHPPSSNTEPGPDEPREATFAQMGLPEIAVNGIGDLPSASVSFSSPPPNPKDIAYMDLVFTHSTLIGTDGSSIRAELNGTAVASIPLNDGNSELTKVRVALPYVALKAGRNILTFRFAVRTVGTLECGPIDSSRGWVVIHPTSLIHLPPAGPKPPLNLALFGYPFLRSGPLLDNAYLETSVLVLPSDRAGWRDALQLALGLGRLTTTDAVSIPAILDRDVTNDLKSTRNLILYGAWGANKLVEEVNSLLPLVFVEETGKSITRERERLVGVQEELPLGVIELTPSPWNKDMATIVLSGTAPETLLWATGSLVGGGLKGNLATVTQRVRTASFDIPFDEASISSRRVALTIPFVGTASVGFLVLGALAMILFEPRLKTGKKGSKKRRGEEQ